MMNPPHYQTYCSLVVVYKRVIIIIFLIHPLLNKSYWVSVRSLNHNILFTSHLSFFYVFRFAFLYPSVRILFSSLFLCVVIAFYMLVKIKTLSDFLHVCLCVPVFFSPFLFDSCLRCIGPNKSIFNLHSEFCLLLIGLTFFSFLRFMYIW